MKKIFAWSVLVVFGIALWNPFGADAARESDPGNSASFGILQESLSESVGPGVQNWMISQALHANIILGTAITISLVLIAAMVLNRKRR